ncbi:hypothetical protein [Mycolicibacterium fortuitum]|uniref:hypothetical protein n=1 Tax=Mycolicibacterium fortuitum TaxID=1766 RepID=UPI0026264AEB|nr:hypothetical protein [Mycolicibacterium fortuitum]
MSKSDTKFEWIDAVCLDERLTVGERYVLMGAILRFINTPFGKTFQVKQTTIADRLAVSPRLVKSTMKNARELGWLILDAHRRRGAGNHAADAYRINIPELGADHAPNDAGIGAQIDEDRCTDRQEKVHESSEIGARPESATCENLDPKVLREGSKEGFERGYAHAPNLLLNQNNNYLDAEVMHEPAPAADLPARIDGIEEISGELVDAETDPEPDEYCPEHMPYGTLDDCPKCMRARIRYDRWKKRNPHHLLNSLLNDMSPADLAVARAQALKRPACPFCRDGGLVLMSDGTPGRKPSACNHDGTRRPATPEEIADYEESRKVS